MADSNIISQNTSLKTDTISNAQTVLGANRLCRIAINQFGALGSLYDARIDCIVDQLSLSETKKIKNSTNTSVNCNIMKDDEFNIDNPFWNIGIHDEVWLNIILKILPAEGIASLVNYSFPKNRNTRYLYYNYISQYESLPHNQEEVMKNIPKEIPEIAATHIVTTVKSGIQAFVILDVVDAETTNLDKFLEDIKKQLIRNEFELNNAEENLFNQIILTKVFSNIPDLIEMKTLVDFCQTLVKIKPDVNHHQKLEYTLTAINIFYPNYPKEKATYISLGPETIKSIKQHLNQLSTKSQQFKMLKVSDREKPKDENVNQKFNQVQRQIKEIEEIYPDEIKRICDLILRIRNGTLQKNTIDELLTDAPKQILQEHTDTTSEPIMSSMKTKELINDSSQQGVDNLNSEELPTNITDNTPIHLQKLKVKDDQKVDSCPNNDTIKIDSIISNPSEENTTRPSDHAEDSSKPSKLLTSSTSEVASSLNESSETVSQSLNSQTKNDVHLTEEQCSHIQLESSQRTEEQFSDSACQLNSSSFKQTNNTQDNDNRSKPSELSIQKDTSQTEKLFTRNKKSCSLSNPPQSSSIEVIRQLSYQPKDAAKQSKSSMLPPLSTLATSRRNEKNLTNTAESPNEFKLPKLSTSGSTSSLNESLSRRENRIQSPSSSSPSNLENILATRTYCSDTKSNNDYINVLLLGESGVGKSTFINALVNYITFESFEKASCTKPVVVMPVSFMMTVGHHFEEKIVTFGDEDSNEDHHHPGQSVTQHCRSYIFPIGTRTKIRFIDTPGMGDTRGLIQDDINMQHILSFITNLSHLNAICILLKPNESRLNIVLRSYFDRLLKFLGENARHNIIFCFTNTRATFFAPGDTAPLLKKMILSCPIKDIPFDKSNTFCFDSESFRYLVAVRSGIEFDQYQKNEYQQSWT
ncbi:unnamed protein product, partial [Rotaria sp. Silwood1]